MPVTSTPGTGKTQLALPGCVAVTVYSNVPNRATRDKCIGRCVNAPLKSLGAAEVLAGAGVDLDLLAGLDEEGDLDLCAGLEGCGLGRVGSGVACKAGVGVGDYEVNEEGRLDVEDLALVYVMLFLCRDVVYSVFAIVIGACTILSYLGIRKKDLNFVEEI